jgi:hypothetical protein
MLTIVIDSRQFAVVSSGENTAVSQDAIAAKPSVSHDNKARMVHRALNR